MVLDWNAIPDDLQLMLSREAMRRAARTIAHQAEILAAEMEHGHLSDQGGPDALRLLAAVVRIADDGALPVSAMSGGVTGPMASGTMAPASLHMTVAGHA